MTKKQIEIVETDAEPIIRYTGIFDYDKLYRDMAAWYGMWGYELQENTHKHKVPLPTGVEQEIKWTGWRKVNEYVRFWVKTHIHGYELKDVEVVKDGVKKKMTKGRLQIIVGGTMDLDYSDRFKGPVAELIQGLLHNYVWKKKIENSWADELYYRIYKLHEVIKESLNMETAYNASDRRY